MASITPVEYAYQESINNSSPIVIMLKRRAREYSQSINTISRNIVISSIFVILSPIFPILYTILFRLIPVVNILLIAIPITLYIVQTELFKSSLRVANINRVNNILQGEAYVLKNVNEEDLYNTVNQVSQALGMLTVVRFLQSTLFVIIITIYSLNICTILLGVIF
jgi:hypothetical protein